MHTMNRPGAAAGDESPGRDRADHPQSKRAKTDGAWPTLQNELQVIFVSFYY